MKIIVHARNEDQEVLAAVDAHGCSVDFVSIDYETKCYRLGINLWGIKPGNADGPVYFGKDWRKKLRKDAEAALREDISRKTKALS